MATFQTDGFQRAIDNRVSRASRQIQLTPWKFTGVSRRVRPRGLAWFAEFINLFPKGTYRMLIGIIDGLVADGGTVTATIDGVEYPLPVLASADASAQVDTTPVVYTRFQGALSLAYPMESVAASVTGLTDPENTVLDLKAITVADAHERRRQAIRFGAGAMTAVVNALNQQYP